MGTWRVGGDQEGRLAPPRPLPVFCRAAQSFAFSWRRGSAAERRGGERAGRIPPALCRCRVLMAPAALCVLLAIGLQLWDPGHAVPAQDMLTPYIPEPGSSCRPREYYDKRSQMCCSMCPPGYHARFFCTATSDTVCIPCEDSTYTQIWNWVPECLSCGSRCSSDQVEMRACTREQDRVCTCRPGRYCMLPSQQGCRLCSELRKCPPGFGVSRPGTKTSNVVCAACAPGKFSDVSSSTDICRPHRICKSTAIPGNASRDAVCTSESLTETVKPTLVIRPQPGSEKPQLTEPTPGPRTTPSPSDPFLDPTLPMGGAITGNISLPIGLIVGVTSLVLLTLVVVNCVIMTQKKKKPFCLRGEAMVPHLPAEKAQGAPGSEQQHLLTTAPSSSSSSLESSASAGDRRATSSNQPQAPGRDQASGSGEARANSRSSESSSGSHGTQVNVTCIVNVCGSSDHGSQCSSQASSTTGTPDSSPSGSPEDEQVPFSKEESPFRSHPGAPETLQQSSEEKPLNFGVPDAGMKPS